MVTERLRRLELYGVQKTHPSETPRRKEASVLVFHMADVETCDASYAFLRFMNAWIMLMVISI